MEIPLDNICTMESTSVHIEDCITLLSGTKIYIRAVDLFMEISKNDNYGHLKGQIVLCLHQKTETY